jgi:guanylate kinase
LLCVCSIKEPGLYDYVIFNDDLEDAFAQLVVVARRALAGQQGNGSGSISGPVTLVAEEEPSTSQQQPSEQVSGHCRSIISAEMIEYVH